MSKNVFIPNTELIEDVAVKLDHPIYPKLSVPVKLVIQVEGGLNSRFIHLWIEEN